VRAVDTEELDQEMALSEARRQERLAGATAVLFVHFRQVCPTRALQHIC
jgi:hypothetical protein